MQPYCTCTAALYCSHTATCSPVQVACHCGALTLVIEALLRVAGHHHTCACNDANTIFTRDPCDRSHAIPTRHQCTLAILSQSSSNYHCRSSECSMGTTRQYNLSSTKKYNPGSTNYKKAVRTSDHQVHIAPSRGQTRHRGAKWQHLHISTMYNFISGSCCFKQEKAGRRVRDAQEEGRAVSGGQCVGAPRMNIRVLSFQHPNNTAWLGMQQLEQHVHNTRVHTPEPEPHRARDTPSSSPPPKSRVAGMTTPGAHPHKHEAQAHTQHTSGMQPCTHTGSRHRRASRKQGTNHTDSCETRMHEQWHLVAGPCQACLVVRMRMKRKDRRT